MLKYKKMIVISIEYKVLSLTQLLVSVTPILKNVFSTVI